MLFNLVTQKAYYVKGPNPANPLSYCELTEELFDRMRMKFYLKTFKDLKDAMSNGDPYHWIKYIREMMTSDDIKKDTLGYDLQ